MNYFAGKHIKEESKNRLRQYCSDVYKLDSVTATEKLKELLKAKAEDLLPILPDLDTLFEPLQE